MSTQEPTGTPADEEPVDVEDYDELDPEEPGISEAERQRRLAQRPEGQQES